MVSANEMEAYLTVSEEKISITRDKVKWVLNQNGVMHGINEKAIDQVITGRGKGRSLLIAQGTEPITGQDGWYEFFFNVDEKHTPLVLKDGLVDYQNTQWFDNVEQGDRIAYYHEAEDGTTGYAVTGRAIQPRRGKEKKVLVGRRFSLLPDRKTYLAAVDGRIEYRDGRLDISQMLILDEVTIATGKVEFAGSIYIKGNVSAGTVIRAKEDVMVDGFVESADIEGGGDIILKQGMNGAGQGSIKAGKNIVGKFF